MTDPAGDVALPARLWQRIRPVLARGTRSGRRRLEQLVHPFRRRSTQAKLRQLPSVESVLVLCYGNICRSPYAAAVLTRQFGERGRTSRVTQGGFIGPNRPANDRAQSVAEGRGIDLAGHRSRLVTAEEARAVDLVVVMEQEQADQVVRLGASPHRVVVLGDLDPGWIDGRTIVDPYGHGATFFTLTYERIDRCISELVRVLDGREANPG